MSQSLKQRLTGNLVNIPGWRSALKIVVIESDDWGSIRVSSKQAYTALLHKKYPVDQCAYNSNDALESNIDLEGLFEVLSSVKDCVGKPAILTANNIVANPDFEKIQDSRFSQYFYEPFPETLKRYPAHDRVMQLYKEGISNQIVKPQFHGREHLHVSNWLEALQSKDSAILTAFEHNMFTVFKGNNSSCRSEYLDAFANYTLLQLDNLESIISEGTKLFEKIWGFTSPSVIAPCYIWHPSIEKILLKNGINHIQSGRVQLIPLPDNDGYKIKRNIMGQRNNLGQVYSIRNCIFEPATQPSKDWVDSCMGEIATAFFWKKPAVISSHRVNFIGYIHKENRERNLKLFKNLLGAILKKWPDVVFMSSDQLGELMTK